jgi:sarcosine oxidase
MGACTAWQLARRGRSVVLLEQFEHPHTRGSSHGGTRIFRVAYRDALYTELAGAAIDQWRQLEHDSGSALLEQNGQLDHGDPAAIDEIAASMERHGWAAQRLRPEDAEERWPGMRFDAAVVYSPDGGRVFADLTVDSAVRSAIGLGAGFVDECPVDQLEQSGDAVLVHTPRGSWAARTVVLACGAWLPALAHGLVRLPEVRITVQQPVHFAIRAGFEFPSYLHHQGADALRFAAYGLTTPGEGLKLGLEGAVHPVTALTTPIPTREESTRDAMAYAERWLPGVDSRQVTAATCLFTETPDSHFILDRAGPFVVCSPCSGHGFKFAPEIGRIAADLVDGGRQSVPVWRLP